MWIQQCCSSRELHLLISNEHSGVTDCSCAQLCCHAMDGVEQGGVQRVESCLIPAGSLWTG